MPDVQTELCQFTTTDGETLHGLLFRPAGPAESDLAILLVHGVAMNFYTGPLPTIAPKLAARGFHVFSANNRGHDWICRAGDLAAFGGATYEQLEDCLLDLDGALGWLAERGYRRFVIAGHSLGSIKAAFYQGARQRPDVVGVLFVSGPRQFYSARAAQQPDFPARLAEAERLVAEGRGDELLWAPASGAVGLFSARTYVSKYGPHERNDNRRHVPRLGCPLLIIFGGAENPTYEQYGQELVEAAGPDRAELRMVEGANHYYQGREAVLTSEVLAWLERLGS